MTIMHLNATLGFFGAQDVEPTGWESVAARAGSLFFTLTYVLLLGAALYHGFYGFRNILMELNPGRRVRTVINVGVSLVGLALFVFGAWAALAAPGAASMVGG
jgi:succinate dehydrogenase/fumarate reductase cytochrome b subunit